MLHLRQMQTRPFSLTTTRPIYLRYRTRVNLFRYVPLIPNPRQAAQRIVTAPPGSDSDNRTRANLWLKQSAVVNRRPSLLLSRRSSHYSANMAASALNEERELAISPIVASSVQHNNQVRHD